MPTLSQPAPDFTVTDPYQILGVLPGATKAEIKRAYFGLIKQYPPEKDAEKFKIIRGAYENLKSEARRAETDALLPKPPPPLPEAPPRTFNANVIRLKPADALLALKHMGDLGRSNFSDDFQEINW